MLISRKIKYDPWKGSIREYVWTDDAACAYSDPSLFQVSQLGDPEVAHLPQGSTSLSKYNREKIKVAQSICEGCPVRATCLETSSQSDRHWSVRGGQAPKRLTAVGNVPSFPLKEYMPWVCQNCGGERFSWYMNKGARRKRCSTCSNDSSA